MPSRDKISWGARATPSTAIGLLDKLAPNTWTGTGFNIIAAPNREGMPTSSAPEFKLILNATGETLEFSKVSQALDRGATEARVTLNTARYVQTVTDCKDGAVIHEEPGLWVHVPPTKENLEDTFVRLAVTPHGDSIFAQSTSFSRIERGPVIQPVNSFPFTDSEIPPLNEDPTHPLSSPYTDPYVGGSLPTTECLPKGLDPAKTIKDPTEVLRAAIQGQTVTETDIVTISAKREQIVNVPFVVSNADAVYMDAIVWVETVKDGASGKPYFQLQYVQRVILNFGDVHWPHVSVATLTLKAS